MDLKTVERLVVERDLIDHRVLSFATLDGTLIDFELVTIENHRKQEVRDRLDQLFPVPPTIAYATPIGPITRFDLESEAYHKLLLDWQINVSTELLGLSMGISGEDVSFLYKNFPSTFITEMQSMIELINGIQSEPMSDLVRDAMYAPEILAWLESYKPKPGELQISDTVLFREMSCIVECGLKLDEWKALSQRQKMIYLTFHDYKIIREGYINWFTFDKDKKK